MMKKNKKKKKKKKNYTTQDTAQGDSCDCCCDGARRARDTPDDPRMEAGSRDGSASVSASASASASAFPTVARFEVGGRACYVEVTWETSRYAVRVLQVPPRAGDGGGDGGAAACWATRGGGARSEELVARVKSLGWFRGTPGEYVALARRALERQDVGGKAFRYAVRGVGDAPLGAAGGGWPAPGEPLVLEWHHLAGAVPLVSEEALAPVENVGGAVDGVLGSMVARVAAMEDQSVRMQEAVAALEARVQLLERRTEGAAEKRRESDARMLQALADVYNRRCVAGGRVRAKRPRIEGQPALAGGVSEPEPEPTPKPEPGPKSEPEDWDWDEGDAALTSESDV